MRLPLASRCSLLIFFVAALLAGCATGPSSVEVSRQQIENALARRFPYEARVAGLASVRVEVPRLELLPAENRIRLDLPVEVSERIAHTGGHAELDVSFGLRYQASDATLRASGVRIEQIDLRGLPDGWRAPVQLAGGIVGERLLEGAELHRFSAEDLARAHGWTPGAIRVTSGGVRIELVPPPR